MLPQGRMSDALTTNTGEAMIKTLGARFGAGSNLSQNHAPTEHWEDAHPQWDQQDQENEEAPFWAESMKFGNGFLVDLDLLFDLKLFKDRSPIRSKTFETSGQNISF
jgi:hypothetical protein